MSDKERVIAERVAKKMAKGLPKVAKELTAGVKVERTFLQDRDGFEEVDITVTIDGITDMAVGKFLVLMDKYSSQVVSEQFKLIRKYSLKTDPLQPVKAEVRGSKIIIRGGFATDLGVLPREELKRKGFKEVG